MIDTLNFRLLQNQFNREHILQVFAKKTRIGEVTFYPNENTAGYYGYKNYTFILSDTALTARGSLTKLHYGNNLQQLSFIQVQDAIKELEDLLEMSLNDAKISRVDFACNMEVNNDVSQYLDLFAAPKGFNTTLYKGGTTYFECGTEKLTLYDKGKQLKIKGRLITPWPHILRYEISIKKKIATVLNWHDAKLENLHNYEYYMTLLNRLYISFMSLPVFTSPKASQLDFDSLTGFKNSLIIEGIRSLGGAEKVLSAITVADIKREYKHSIRKYINNLPPGEILNLKLKQEVAVKLLAICKKEARLAFEWSD